MAVLGLILLAAAGVLTAAVVTSNTTSLSMDLWGVNVSNITLGVVFVAGMITTVLAVVGFGLLMGGMRRSRRLRQERRSLRKENEQLSQRVDATGTGTDRGYEPAPVHQDTRPLNTTGPVREQTADGAPVAAEQPRRRGFLPRRDASADDPAGTRH